MASGVRWSAVTDVLALPGDPVWWDCPHPENEGMGLGSEAPVGEAIPCGPAVAFLASVDDLGCSSLRPCLGVDVGVSCP